MKNEVNQTNYLYTNKQLSQLIFPLVIEQLLVVLVGMATHAPINAGDIITRKVTLRGSAGGTPEALHALPMLLNDMPRSIALLKQPLAIEV